jgi:hypothetical protein
MRGALTALEFCSRARRKVAVRCALAVLEFCSRARQRVVAR